MVTLRGEPIRPQRKRPIHPGRGPNHQPSPPIDPLRRAVHIALTLYLVPALLAVLLVGGIALVLQAVGRGIRGVWGLVH